MTQKIELDRLRDVLDYTPETGVFTWKKRSGNNTYSVGDTAGSINSNGHRQIQINSKRYLSHRLAWLYVYGNFPFLQIDHINRDRGDNRLINLRLATQEENQKNVSLRRDNTSGYKGVSWCKNRKMWHSQARINGKNKSLGYYITPQLASQAYNTFCEISHGKFYNNTTVKI